jgi:formate dehydrogenase alpha subunit
VAGLATVFGSGAMTNSIGEIEDADVIFVIGSNTTENHPVISTFVKRAALKGAKLIVADPRKITLVRHATLWLRQRPGTDVALVNGLVQVVLSEGLENKAFIEGRTENFEALKKAVAAYTPDKVERITGVPTGDLVEAARTYAQADKAAILYAMGITQHTTGTDNVKALANLAMVTGNVGRPSTGVNPLRGQNNVQGACDMGGLPEYYPGYQVVTEPKNKGKFSQAWQADLSDRTGLTLIEMMNAVGQGRIKGLYVLGENPILSDPDAGHVEEALKKCGFLVVQDIFMTETARLADVVLPGASFAEKDGTFTNTERRVSRVRKAVEPPGQARTDLDILNDLAARMGLKWSATAPEAVMVEIAGLTPSYAGISYARLEGDGLVWPCPDASHPGTPILHRESFSRGKGLFSVLEHREPAEPPSDEYPYTMTTGRILYQYHGGSMSRRSVGLEYLAPRCEVEIHPDDAAELGLEDGDRVTVTSRRGEITAFAKVTDRVPPKTISIPFHYAEAAVNKLTNPALDPVSKIPEYKVCAVRMRKAGEAAEAKSA